MLRTMVIVLYTGLVLGANMAQADIAAAKNVLAGDMRKLVFQDGALVDQETVLEDMTGTPRSLAEWQGRWVVLNFWATWCVPCRKEMPDLDQLAASTADTDIAVVTVATIRSARPGVERFLAKAGIENLPVLLDLDSAFAKKTGVIGLPVTLILNPKGEEVARLIGEADWASPDARAMLDALTQD